MNSLLRIFIGVVVVGGAVGLGAYLLESAPVAPACSTPIAYRVGTLDPRFKVSESEFKSALSEAAAVWNEAHGKTLVTFSEEGELPVSLVYDERQQAAQLGAVINSDQAAYQAKRDEVDALISAHDARVASHEAALASFERQKAAYDQEVAKWNAKGGAPAGEYEKLQEMRRNLERRQAEINAEAGRLNAMIAEVNGEVQELNVLASRVNTKVDVYNEFAGSEFDQGQYIEDKDGVRITIYEFRTRAQLVRALAHEFGHALGISHTEDPQSLMYPYNTGTDIELHADDIAALSAVCGSS